MFPNRPPDTPATAAQATALGDRPGVLPRHLQTWVVLGIAVSMTGIIALVGLLAAGRPTPGRRGERSAARSQRRAHPGVSEAHRRGGPATQRGPGRTRTRRNGGSASRGGVMTEPVVRQPVADAEFAPEAGHRKRAPVRKAYQGVVRRQHRPVAQKGPGPAGHDGAAAAPAAAPAGRRRQRRRHRCASTTYPGRRRNGHRGGPDQPIGWRLRGAGQCHGHGQCVLGRPSASADSAGGARYWARPKPWTVSASNDWPSHSTGWSCRMGSLRDARPIQGAQPDREHGSGGPSQPSLRRSSLASPSPSAPSAGLAQVNTRAGLDATARRPVSAGRRQQPVPVRPAYPRSVPQRAADGHHP